MSEFHDDSTRASDSQPIGISDTKLRRLAPELFGWRGWFFKQKWGPQQLNAREMRKLLSEHMSFGDTRAALVARVDPLVVAAYTDEQDAVLLLRFPQWLAEEYGLKPGMKLLTANTYGRGNKLMPDIRLGPKSTGRWMNFYPIIAEFVSDDAEVIERRKEAISDEEWKRAAAMTRVLLADRNATVRDGRPLVSNKPGAPLTGNG